MATITVTTAADTENPNDGLVSLREAIATANSGDTIDCSNTLDGATIRLTSGAELVITQAPTIDASALASGITVNAGGTYIQAAPKPSLWSSAPVPATSPIPSSTSSCSLGSSQ